MQYLLEGDNLFGDTAWILVRGISVFDWLFGTVETSIEVDCFCVLLAPDPILMLAIQKYIYNIKYCLLFLTTISVFKPNSM